MSDAFDPYYIWLGIPPDDQPPNHYRLLGIELFEASDDVIEAAANRQMAYMQEISAGETHIDEAQKILGELSRARICLLSAKKKEAYDAELRTRFDSLDQASEEQDADQGTQTPAVASPRDRDKSFLPPQTPTETPAQTEDDESDTAPILGTDAPRVGPAKKHRATTRKKKKKQDATVPILVGIGAAILVAIFLMVVLNSAGSKTRKQPTARERQKEKFEKQPKANIDKRNRQDPLRNKNVRRQPPRPPRDTTGTSPTSNVSADNDSLSQNLSKFNREADRSNETTSELEKPATAEAAKENTPVAEIKPTVTNAPNAPDEQVAPTEQPKPIKPIAQATPPPATMPAMTDLNRDQRALLETAAAEYKKVTRQEFQALLLRGRELGQANGATWGGLPHGGTTRNSGTKQRFYFLGWHHPSIATTHLTPEKKSPEPFNQEMKKAVWKAVRNTPAWRDASK